MTAKLASVFEAKHTLRFNEYVDFLSVERRREGNGIVRLARDYMRHGFWLAPSLMLLVLAAFAFVERDPNRGYYLVGAVAIWFGASLISDALWRRHFDRAADKTLTLIVTENGMEQCWAGCRWSAPWGVIDFVEIRKQALIAAAGSVGRFYMPLSGFPAPEQAKACLDFTMEKINVARSS